MIRMIIADDHPIVRGALKSLLTSNGMCVVEEAENGDEVLDLLDKTDCDLLILDISMPGESTGPELIKQIISRSKAPL